MTDVILQIGASKLAISIGLAGVAWLVARRLGSPPLAHGLWLLPLAVLLVPPFALHAALRWPRVRHTDFTSRRAVLRLLAVGAGGFVLVVSKPGGGGRVVEAQFGRGPAQVQAEHVAVAS